MSEWIEATLGELVQQVDERKGVQKVPLVLSVTEKRGIIPQDEVFKKRIATDDTSKYKVLQPLDIAYNPYLLWTGAIGQWSGREPGVTSPVYETFRTRPEHEPRFVGLILTGGSLTPYFNATAIGSIQRRRRTPVPVFLAATTRVPALAEQRRIVAVMATVEAQIDAFEKEVDGARRTLRRYLETSFDSLDCERTAIVDLCSTVIGGIWGSPEGESEVDVLALGPRVYGFGTSYLRTPGSPVRSFSTKQIADRQVREGDIILERSGGSKEQPVARVVIAGSGLDACIPTDFQRLLRPDRARVVPRFLFWRLQDDWNRGISRSYSRRTTGITNLSVKEYIAREISVPDMGVQEAFVEGADVIETTVAALAAELDTMRIVRAALLNALLSQEITVDAAVEKFVKAA